MRFTPDSRSVIEAVSDSYEGAPPEIRELGLERLLNGLETYGDAHFTELSEREWLHEALEELVDSFNMLVGMRTARGELPVASGSILAAINRVQCAIQELPT